MKASTRCLAYAVVGAFMMLSAAVPAVAQNHPSGYAIKVDPKVNATGPGGQRLIELQGAVFMGDQIVARPVGLAQIKCIDHTRLVVGPSSRLTIDTFVFNPDWTARDVTITALKGTFRFIRGNSQPGVYTIRTPTST